MPAGQPLDHRTRLVIRIIVDDQNFPFYGIGNFGSGNALQRSRKRLAAVIGTQYDCDHHRCYKRFPRRCPPQRREIKLSPLLQLSIPHSYSRLPRAQAPAPFLLLSPCPMHPAQARQAYWNVCGSRTYPTLVSDSAPHPQTCRTMRRPSADGRIRLPLPPIFFCDTPRRLDRSASPHAPRETGSTRSIFSRGKSETPARSETAVRNSPDRASDRRSAYSSRAKTDRANLRALE